MQTGDSTGDRAGTDRNYFVGLATKRDAYRKQMRPEPAPSVAPVIFELQPRVRRDLSELVHHHGDCHHHQSNARVAQLETLGESDHKKHRRQ
jgi:hypothetical protein